MPSDDSPRLPQELIEEIFVLLKGNLRSLRTCALASRTFLAISRRTMYQNLVVIAGTLSRMADIGLPDFVTARHFRNLLEYAPHIGLICLSIHFPETYLGTSIRSYSFAVKDAILNTLSLPSLASLEIWSMPHVVLQGKQRLQHLSIGSLGGMGSLEDCTVPLDNRCVIESLQMKFDGDRNIGRKDDDTLRKFLESIVDITNLKYLFLICCNTVEYQHAAALVIKICGKRLQCLVLDHRDNFNPPKGIDSLLLEDLLALKKLHVRLNIPHLPETIPQLIALLNSLPPAHVNRLRELTIQVNQGSYDHETYFPSWVDLWNLVTNVERFPRLRKMTVMLFSYEGLDRERIKEWEKFFAIPERPQLRIEIKLLNEAAAFDTLYPFWPDPDWDKELPKRKNFTVV